MGYFWNRCDLNIKYNQYNLASNDRCVIITHWLYASSASTTIQAIKEAFLNEWYGVLTFDATNNGWESDWNICDASVDWLMNNLEDTIQYIKKEFDRKIYLAWHCMWASVSKYIMNNKNFPISWCTLIAPYVWWKYEREYYLNKYWPHILAEWIRDGRILTKHTWNLPIAKKISWNQIKDRLRYDFSQDLLTWDTRKTFLLYSSNDDRVGEALDSIIQQEQPTETVIMKFDYWSHNFQLEDLSKLQYSIQGLIGDVFKEK